MMLLYHGYFDQCPEEVQGMANVSVISISTPNRLQTRPQVKSIQHNLYIYAE